MAHRTFRDAAGAAWQAWDTYPSARRGKMGVSGALTGGWLCFERLDAPGPGAAEKRRLAPVPAGWEALPEAALHALIAGCAPVAPSPRRGGVHRPS